MSVQNTQPGYEHSPSYRVLMENHMLNDRYRIATAEDIEAHKANTTYGSIVGRKAASWVLPVLGPVAYGVFFKDKEIADGYLQPYTWAGKFFFCGAGLHFFASPFVKFVGDPIKLPASGAISHGTRHVVVIEQGFVGLGYEAGQPVLLAPGMHQINSPTFTFEQCIPLNKTVVRLGPYTLVTVENGYAGVAYDNGKQVILSPGTHFLGHRNFVFRKFLPHHKVQTDTLDKLRVSTADNVLMTIDSTVCWIVEDVDKAARGAADMRHNTGHEGSDIEKMREDVIKQAQASLAALIGGIKYSDKRGGLSAQASDEDATEEVQRATKKSAVAHSNAITGRYGVRILSINIVSAFPADKDLQNSLAAGAVAQADAVMKETSATGEANARKITATSIADQEIIKAKGEAEAEQIRAEGLKAAAEILETSDVAVKLESLRATGRALGDKSTFFFGQDPQALGNLFQSFAGNTIVKK